MAQRDWADKDFYKVLGLDKSASKDDIKRAYRKLAPKHDTDADKVDASAEARFKEISEAYAILSNDDKRAEYDQMRKLIEAGGSRFYGLTPRGDRVCVRVNIGEIGDLFGGASGGSAFEDLFSGFGFRPTGPEPGADLESEAVLDFDQAVSGATLTLENGSKVRIPPGVRDGARIRVPGRGHPSPNGGPPGDLYVRVKVQPHPVFTLGRDGDVIVTVPVTFPEAALGAKVEVPAVDGSVTVKVPAGTTSGRTLRVKGRGAARPKGGRGDLLVKVEVDVPRRISRREKEALEAFAAAHDASPRGHLDEYIRTSAKKAS